MILITSFYAKKPKVIKWLFEFFKQDIAFKRPNSTRKKTFIIRNHTITIKYNQN